MWNKIHQINSCTLHGTILREAIIVIFYLRSTIVIIIYSKSSKIFYHFWDAHIQHDRITCWRVCEVLGSCKTSMDHVEEKKGSQIPCHLHTHTHTMLKINFKCVSSLHSSLGTWQLLSEYIGGSHHEKIRKVAHLFSLLNWTIPTFNQLQKSSSNFSTISNCDQWYGYETLLTFRNDSHIEKKREYLHIGVE